MSCFFQADDDIYVALSDTFYPYINGTQPDLNLCRMQPDINHMVVSLIIQCTSPVSGRYAYIYQPGSKWKTAHEIELYESIPSSKCKMHSRPLCGKYIV